MYYYGARYYDPKMSLFISVDQKSEDYPGWMPYHYVHQNPINMVDPTGMSAEPPTEYKTASGKTLLKTNDGSNDVITVPDAMVGDFKQYNASYQNGNQGLYDSQSWNDNMKASILGFETLGDMDNVLGDFTRQWSRQNAIDYLQNPTIGSGMGMAFSEALSQWSDPEKLVMGASIFVGGLKPSMRTSSLEATQTITKSKAPMQALLDDIAKNGVKEPISYVRSGGSNYIVDGHHRFYSAQKLGIKNVPVQRVKLPFKGYKSATDLVKEGRQPGYWNHMKAKK